MFRPRHQLRQWAACVLLLWLCGLGVGVANACLSPAAMQPGDAGATRVAAQGLHGLASLPCHHADPADDPASPVKSNCQDFCEKASVSMLPKSALDAAHGAALPCIVAAIVLPMPAFAPALEWVPRREGVPAPPIPIAFVRLTR